MNNSEPEALRADIAYIFKVNELNEKVHKLPLPPPTKQKRDFLRIKNFCTFYKKYLFHEK